MTTYSETQVLTYEQVLDELRAIVAEKGADYTYPKVDFSQYEADGEEYIMYGQCVYFDPKDGTPSCIVGHWLARHDVYLWNEEEGLLCDLNLETSINDILTDHYWVLPFTVDARALALLTVVQRMQDSGSTWGTALNKAAEIAATTLDHAADPCAGA